VKKNSGFSKKEKVISKKAPGENKAKAKVKKEMK
jgi:hypothetical protein